MIKKYKQQPEVYRRIEWANVVMTHSLLVLMMGCVGLVVSQVMRRLAPGWPYASLPWLCMLISREAMGSWLITRRAADLEVSPVTSLLIEWIVLLILIRIYAVPKSPHPTLSPSDGAREKIGSHREGSPNGDRSSDRRSYSLASSTLRSTATAGSTPTTAYGGRVGWGEG